MELLRHILARDLKNIGILEIEGKPVEECSQYELQDELRRIEEERDYGRYD